MRQINKAKKMRLIRTMNGKRKVIAFVVVFAVIGVAALVISKAATPSVSLEAEQGDVSGGAQIINDSTASGGSAVKFSGNVTPPLTYIRGAFYYPWFPEAWNQQGYNPFTNYTPTLGFYSNTDPAVINKHIDEMIYAGMNSAIYSWWGQGSKEDNRFQSYLAATGSKPLKWAIYHECEGNASGGTCAAVGGPSPSVASIQSDLSYIKTKYASDSHYLNFNGKPVVFVYGDGTDSCTTVANWKAANINLGSPFHLVLKVFGGYTGCASQPDNWHQYGPASAQDIQAGYSIAISPGYWKRGCEPINGGICTQGGTQPYLARDLVRWQQNVTNLKNSTVPIRLVTTFNEWGEGSIIESANEWASASGHGGYIDILHNTLVGTTDTEPPTAPTKLTATAVSSTQVNLTWVASTDNVGVARYEINRNGSVLKTITAPATSNSDTTAVANTAYSYTITAIDAAGLRSTVSNTAPVTTLPDTACTPITTPPTSFTVALASGKTVNLAWVAPTPKVGECTIDKYVITRNGQVIANPTGVTFADTTTNYNATYTYLIQAHDTSGALVPTAGLASTPATITTPAVVDTSPPDVPTAAVNITSTTSVTVSWNAVQDNPKSQPNAGIAGYKVFRNGTKIATTPANATSYGDQLTFTQGTSYNYSVSAFDAATPANESAQSTAVNVIPNPTASASYTVVGAGDIGMGSTGAEATGKLIEALNPTANAVLTLGDNAYDSGTATQFTNNYDPWWGPFKAKTYPSPGNHDYITSGASGYYNYFGASGTTITGHTVSGSPAAGYYAFSIGSSWRFYSLNTEVNQIASNTFLGQDLAANPKLCTLAYYHKPPFSSSATHPEDGYSTRSTFVQTLYNNHGDLILGGHQHHYERFAPLTPSNTVDAATGIRSFVVGTGGAGLYGIGTPQTGSEVRNQVDRGIIILTIRDNGTYHWEFRAVGTYRDSGDGSCRP